MLKNLNVESESLYNINKKNVHAVVSSLKKELNFSISFLQINFVSSQYIKSINEEYLKHEGSTDIITFNYSGDNNKLDGECFLSIEDAKTNAERFGVHYQNELLRLVIHGILHLVGYDDIKENDREIMKQKENYFVNAFGNTKFEVLKEHDE